MSLVLLASLVLAGLVFVLTPGPAMLALFALVAGDGRRAGALFMAGQGAGDVMWAALGVASVLGLSTLGPHVSAGVGIVCGLYLLWLGVLSIRHAGDASFRPIGSARPFATGAVMGFTNPKSYPVFVALFGAAVAGHEGELALAAAPVLILALGLGYLAALLLLLLLAGLDPVRRRFVAHRTLIGRAVGFVFVAFGARLTVDSVRSLRA